MSAWKSWEGRVLRGRGQRNEGRFVTVVNHQLLSSSFSDSVTENRLSLRETFRDHQHVSIATTWPIMSRAWTPSSSPEEALHAGGRLPGRGQIVMHFNNTATDGTKVRNQFGGGSDLPTPPSVYSQQLTGSTHSRLSYTANRCWKYDNVYWCVTSWFFKHERQQGKWIPPHIPRRITPSAHFE